LSELYAADADAKILPVTGVDLPRGGLAAAAADC